MISPYTYLDIDPTPVHKAADHYAFHPAPTDDHDVKLRTYTTFIPADQSDTTFLNDGEYSHRFNYNDDTDRWEYRKSYNTYVTLPEPGTDEFHTEINTLLDDKFERKRKGIPGQLWKEPDPDIVPTSSKNEAPKRLNQRFFSWHHSEQIPQSPWYEFHKQYPTHDDLTDLPRIGDVYADALKNQAIYNPHGTPPEHKSIVNCPNCNTAWKAHYPHYIMTDARALQAIVYCPECAHTDIPTSHITNPQPLLLD